MLLRVLIDVLESFEQGRMRVIHSGVEGVSCQGSLVALEEVGQSSFHILPVAILYREVVCLVLEGATHIHLSELGDEVGGPIQNLEHEEIHIVRGSHKVERLEHLLIAEAHIEHREHHCKLDEC